jgi:hypothetical protein
MRVRLRAGPEGIPNRPGRRLPIAAQVNNLPHRPRHQLFSRRTFLAMPAGAMALKGRT